MTVKQVFNTSAELDYPTVLPTLDLDFANSKTLDPRIDFTRASGGTYVGADGLIKYAGVNEARFDHDPVTGESLGLLVEEVRINLLASSEEFNLWGKSNASVIENIDISPNGTKTADKVIENSSETSSTKFLNRFIPIVSNTNYTFSVFLKAEEIRYVRLFYGQSGSPFTRIGITVDLLTGLFTSADVGTPTSITTKKVDYFGNGWYRVQIGGIFDTTSTTGYIELRFQDETGQISTYPGDGVSGFYLWGAQLEQGSFATSYIPTLSTTRTRAADSVEITGKNFSDFFNKNEGTSLITYRPRFDGNYQSPFATFFAFSDNITTARTMGFAGNSNSTQLYFLGSASSLSTTILPGFTWLSPPTPSSKRTERAVVSYGADYIRMYENSNSFFSTSPTYGRGKIEDIFKTQVNPPSVNYVRFLIGDKNGNSRFNCTVQNFRYYPKDLGPQTLKNISQIYP
jgi:hypothetical protein